MKVHQIVQENELSSVISDISSTVSRLLGGDDASTTPQQRQPTARIDPIENPCGEFGDQYNAAEPNLFAAIDQAIQSGNKALLLRVLNRGPQTTTSRFQGFDQWRRNQQAACWEGIRRRMISHMANHITRSRQPGSQRNDWLAFGRARPNLFIDIVLDPTKAAEVGR